MSGVDKEELERRLSEASATLAKLPRGTVAYRDAQNSVYHLQRVIMAAEELPRTMDPRGVARRP